MKFIVAVYVLMGLIIWGLTTAEPGGGFDTITLKMDIDDD